MPGPDPALRFGPSRHPISEPDSELEPDGVLGRRVVVGGLPATRPEPELEERMAMYPRDDPDPASGAVRQPPRGPTSSSASQIAVSASGAWIPHTQSR